MKVILAKPRGFCAGVERAIEIVEKALKKYGPPVYVRHEIVHNKYVVDDLKAKGAIFVKEVDEIPKGAITIFSAHGVAQSVESDSEERDLSVIDATCPLVKKVHNEAIRAEKNNEIIVLIGHKGHPEVEGTSGRVEKSYLVEDIEDVKNLDIKSDKISYVTQTTLSVDDTKNIINALKEKFPHIKGPDLKDICYATQNRQNAVRELAKITDIILVIGSTNSSNSNRLRDLASEFVDSYLISGESDINLDWFNNKHNIGITAGASAPEILVEKVIDFLKDNFEINVTILDGIEENVHFKLPDIL